MNNQNGNVKNEPINEKTSVPYIVFEGEMARAERREKRQWVAIIILIAALLLSNLAWVIYESTYEDVVSETVETSAEGGGNAYGTLITGDNSEVNYGESKSYQD